MKEDNNSGISRRSFLKTTALAGAALAMPSGLNSLFAAETNQNNAPVNDSEAAHITGHRTLGTGKAAFEVSSEAASMNIPYSTRTTTTDKPCRASSRKPCVPTRASSICCKTLVVHAA